MPEKLDAGRLLRRKWNDPDELARELYVLLSGTHGLLQGIGRNPVLLSRANVGLGGHPGPNVLGGNPRLLRARTQARAAARVAINNLVQGRPIPQPTVIPGSGYPPLRFQQPAPIAVNGAGVAALPPALQREYKAQASTDIALAQQFAQGARPRAVITRPQSYTPLRASQPTVQGPPIRVTEESKPVTSPAVRGLQSVPPTAPARPDDRRQTPAPVRAPYRTDIERAQPRSASQVINIAPGRDVEFAPDASEAQVSYGKHRETDDWQSRFTRLELPTSSRILMQVGPDGIPGLTSSSSGDALPAQPGQGVGYALDYGLSSNQLDYYDQTDQTLFNISLLPVSGDSIVVCFLLGEYWIVEPVVFCHGVVSEDIGPSDDESVGSGMATPWYVQQGDIAEADEDVQVENWYSVTAMSGTNCGLMACDGTVSLEVLDCTSS